MEHCPRNDCAELNTAGRFVSLIVNCTWPATTIGENTAPCAAHATYTLGSTSPAFTPSAVLTPLVKTPYCPVACPATSEYQVVLTKSTASCVHPAGTGTELMVLPVLTSVEPASRRPSVNVTPVPGGTLKKNPVRTGLPIDGF